jgi:hypothetical protein
VRSDLDAGEPILMKKEIPNNLEIKLGEWFIPALFVTDQAKTGDKETLVILMMIERH